MSANERLDSQNESGSNSNYGVVQLGATIAIELLSQEWQKLVTEGQKMRIHKAYIPIATIESRYEI